LVYYDVARKKHTSQLERPIPSLKGHIWIEGNEGTFLGYGRIALLERIREYGSITKAAKRWRCLIGGPGFLLIP